MSFWEFVEFITLAITKENEHKIREEYLSILPILIFNGKYMTFEQFQEKMTGADIDWRPTDEILKMAEDIQEKFANGY